MKIKKKFLLQSYKLSIKILVVVCFWRDCPVSPLRKNLQTALQYYDDLVF